MRNTLFAGTDVIDLQTLQYRGKRVDVRIQVPIQLPPAGGQGGYYEVSSVTLNGTAATTDIIPASSLQATNVTYFPDWGGAGTDPAGGVLYPGSVR